MFEILPTGVISRSRSSNPRPEFFSGYPSRSPVYAPFTTPSYSNAAFRILGYVIERVTHQSYELAVQETIFKPLGLKRSSVTKPRDTASGVIPVGNSSWDFDFGGEAA